MTSERDRAESIREYAESNVKASRFLGEAGCRAILVGRFEKAFSVLPDEVADLFLSGKRRLTVIMEPDPGLPSGMRTQADGPREDRRHTIIVFREHLEWPEDLFLGALLRELGHVVGNRPPESEWPEARSERTRFKELLENRADAVVWKWGLRHYNMRFLAATYPPHRLDDIIAAIERNLVEH